MEMRMHNGHPEIQGREEEYSDGFNTTLQDEVEDVQTQKERVVLGRSADLATPSLTNDNLAVFRQIR